MIRIGIIGTESSHALAFAKYFNLPGNNGEYPFENIRVAALLGDAQSVDAIRSAVDIEFVAERPEDMLGHIDAVMITSRCGSAHYAQLLPLIRSGMPVFIDKPFTSCVQQAQELTALLQQNKNPVVGGSNCKYGEQVQLLKKRVKKLREEQKLLSASLNFTLYDSPYDGFWFYAPHLVDIALEVFGYTPVKVTATSCSGSVVAVLTYPDVAIALHFTRNLLQGSVTLYTGDDVYHEKLSTNGALAIQAEHFGNVILGGEQPHTLEQITRHVYVIDELLRSISDCTRGPLMRCGHRNNP